MKERSVGDIPYLGSRLYEKRVTISSHTSFEKKFLKQVFFSIGGVGGVSVNILLTLRY